MADTTRTATIHGARFARVQFKLPSASTWTDIPGIGSLTEEQGETPTTEIRTVSGAATILDTPPLPTFTVSLTAAALAHPSFPLMRQYRRDSTPLNFRAWIPETVFETGSSADAIDIDTSGVVSLAGSAASRPDFTGETYDVGTALIVRNTDVYVVSDISAAGVATVEPAPMATITDEEDWELAIPAILFGPFNGRISGGTAFGIEQGGVATSTVAIAMTSNPPDPAPVATGILV